MWSARYSRVVRGVRGRLWSRPGAGGCRSGLLVGASPPGSGGAGQGADAFERAGVIVVPGPAREGRWSVQPRALRVRRAGMVSSRRRRVWAADGLVRVSDGVSTARGCARGRRHGPGAVGVKCPVGKWASAWSLRSRSRVRRRRDRGDRPRRAFSSARLLVSRVAPVRPQLRLGADQPGATDDQLEVRRRSLRSGPHLLRGSRSAARRSPGSLRPPGGRS